MFKNVFTGTGFEPIILDHESNELILFTPSRLITNAPSGTRTHIYATKKHRLILIKR